MEEFSKISCVRNFAAELRAHIVWIRNHADPAEIEPIRIPAGRNRWIRVMIAISVPYACFVKKVEAIVAEIEGASTERSGEFRTACSMAFVETVIQTAAVMEKREKPDDLDVRTGPCGEQQAVPFNPPPVIGSVNRIAANVKLCGDLSPETLKIDVHVKRMVD